MEHLTTIIVALIGGGAVSLVQFLIQRHDAKQDKNDEVMRAINSLDQKMETKLQDINTKIDALSKKQDQTDAKMDENNTIDARIRILHFADELLEGRKHSKDSYDQCMSDITIYNKYCDTHPLFKNDQTVSTVRYIRRNYDERLEKHDFL